MNVWVAMVDDRTQAPHPIVFSTPDNALTHARQLAETMASALDTTVEDHTDKRGKGDPNWMLCLVIKREFSVWVVEREVWP